MVHLTRGRLSVGTAVSDFTSALAVHVTGTAGGPVEKTPDFDGNGTVDFSDFLIFAGGFGKAQGEAGFDARLDFDENGKVDFPDFLQFAQRFGKRVGG